MILSKGLSKNVAEICEKIYNKKGIQAVITYADSIELNYDYCKHCEADMPMIEAVEDKSCAVCGSVYNKSLSEFSI